MYLLSSTDIIVVTTVTVGVVAFGIILVVVKLWAGNDMLPIQATPDDDTVTMTPIPAVNQHGGSQVVCLNRTFL